MGKFGSIIVLLLVVMMGPAQTPASSDRSAQINWSTYDEAQRSADNTRKRFLYFFSDQCGYCRMMEEKTFKNKAVINYINSNYTPVRVNAGREARVASLFGIRGVPDLRFLTAKGEGIARWPGYIESARLITLLQYIYTDSYKKMNFKDFVAGPNGDIKD